MKKRLLMLTDNEDGSILLIVVLILISVTLLGIFATNTTTIEIQIAGNDRFHKVAFHNADSGVYTIPKVISQAINDKATPNLGSTSPFTYLDGGTDDDGSSGPTFYRELAGLDAYDAAPDIEFTIGGTNLVQIDVQRGNVINIPGGGAEFASGAEGAGTSHKGTYYNLDSFGSGPGNSQSNVGARYLKAIGTAEGM